MNGKDILEERHDSYRVNVLVWAALLILTGLTVAISRSAGGIGVIVPLFIASLKAALVVYFFMRLRDEKGAYAVMTLISIGIIIILFLLVFSDVAFR